MATTFKIITFVLVCIIFLSCSTKKTDHPYSSLTVTFDTSFHYNFYNQASVLIDAETIEGTSTYDTTTHTVSHYWDSLASGNCTFKLKTIFYHERLIPVTLNADTAFTISEVFESVDLFTKDELLKADTVEFVYTSNGCFHSYYEKSIITHIGNKYILRTNSNSISSNSEPLNIQKQLTASIIDSVYNFASTFKKEREKLGHNDVVYLSTTTGWFYLKIHNKVFQICDQELQDKSLYDNFKYANITKGQD